MSDISISYFCGCMKTSTPSVEIAVNVRPALTESESTPPCPKIYGFSTNTTSCPASGEYELQPTMNPNMSTTIATAFFIGSPVCSSDLRSEERRVGKEC